MTNSQSVEQDGIVAGNISLLCLTMPHAVIKYYGL